MTSSKTILVLIILAFLSSGCGEKNELKLPVNLFLNIGILPSAESSAAEYFYFNWCHIGVESIEFEGKREAGRDVYFVTTPESDQKLIEFNEKPERISVIDLPQGIYNHMAWEIYLKKIDTSGLTGKDLPNTGIIIWAIYEYLDGSEISIFFCIDYTELLNFKSYDSHLNSTIVLSENIVHKVDLLFDLNYTFSTISRESIESAEISNDIHGQPIIVISSSNNKDLYQNLLYRFSITARALVN